MGRCIVVPTGRKTPLTSALPQSRRGSWLGGRSFGTNLTVRDLQNKLSRSRDLS
jgi:hypothetical protein